jgi:pimeloyl-ACP methyl ester carboxylesterase
VTIIKGYADGPFGQLHYETTGDGVPVIFLHQMVQSAVQFRPALPHLANHGVKAIAVDLPGYGMSSTPDHAPTTDEYASIVPALLEHFGLQQAVVCGHHTGASIACAAAHRHPERVSKVVLHGVPYFTHEEMAEHAARSHSARPVADDGSHFNAVWDLFSGLSNGDISADVTHQSVMTYFMAGETEWHGHNAVFNYDIWAAVEEIKAPTLLISNTGDMLNPQDRELAKARPDFEFKEIQGGTFQYVYDDAESWAKIVADFVTGA